MIETRKKYPPPTDDEKKFLKANLTEISTTNAADVRDVPVTAEGISSSGYSSFSLPFSDLVKEKPKQKHSRRKGKDSANEKQEDSPKSRSIVYFKLNEQGFVIH